MAAPDCAECIKARPGQRVVRGPDWWGGSEDGGSDHVGTIISVYQPGTDSGYSTHPVEVHWDAGPLGYYRAGCSYGTCDLRLIDAGPAGVVFSDISCGYCETKGLVGTRWKCVKCADYNLCHSCYMGDKHNVEHEFLRYDDPASVGCRVQPRKQSTKVPFHGIYPGAEVQSHDGVKNGIVGNDRGKARLLRKTAGGKLFYNNTDKVDDSLKLQKAACGGYYYQDHMPAIALPGHDPRDIELFSSNRRMMSAGDCVSVLHDSEPLKRLQLAARHTFFVHPDWCCGKEGRVLEVSNLCCLKVQINNVNGTFNPESLVQVRRTSQHTMNMPGRDISSGGKGLGYVLCTPALHAACRLGDDDAVTMLLTAGADLEEADKNGDTAAHHASGWEASKILELLISAEANMGACNNFNETALHVAIKENSVRCARLLANNIKDSDINIQNNVGDTVLHTALDAGMQDTISVLLQHPRVNVGIKNDEGETPLHVAVAKANLRATQQILQISTEFVDVKNKKNVTALHVAAENNLYEIAKTLVAQGQCNVDIECGSDLKTALAMAVSRGCSDVVELLVESGANVNKSDCKGNAPLHLCATNTRPLILPSPSGAPKLSMMVNNRQGGSSQRQLTGLALAGMLASKGGDLQQKNKNGLTPPELCDSTALIEMLLLWNIQESATGQYREQLAGLINAKDKDDMILLQREARDGRHHIAQMMLAQGLVAVDAVGGKGSRTALSLAAERGHMQLVNVLVEAGADVNKVDAKGNTPLHSSLMSHRFEIIEILVTAGADVNKQDANGNTPLHISLMNQRAVKASEINPAAAPKLKAIATELQNVKHGDIDNTVALACFFISSGASLRVKNVQGLNPLNLLDAMPVIKALLKWAPKTREPPAEEPSVDGSAEGNTAGAEGGASSSTEGIDAPGPSDEQANCSSAKDEPKEEEIDDRHACAICMEKERTVAFLCGHGTCQECATKIQHCHVCRAPVEKIIKLYEG